MSAIMASSWMPAHVVVAHPRLVMTREYPEAWYCFWDDSYGVPCVGDSTVEYVFKYPLRVAASGVITTSNASAALLSAVNSRVESPLQQLIENLRSLAQDICRKGCSSNSESGYELLPFAAPLQEAPHGKLDAATILAALGAHARLRASAIDMRLADILSDDDDDGTLRHEVSVLLGGEAVVFECGRGQLNPIPVFILTVTRTHSAIVGFLTAKVDA